jgi:omega-6 fatty acid desaturase (delta-12 desaturase)
MNTHNKIEASPHGQEASLYRQEASLYRQEASRYRKEASRYRQAASRNKREASLFPLTKPFARAMYGSALWQLVNTLALFVLSIGLMFATVEESYAFCLGLSVVASIAYMRLFMIGHDCGHGAFLPERWQNIVVGNLMGVLTNTPIGYWARQHHLHHQGNGHLDRRGNGDVEMMTIDEYKAAPWRRRAWYRLFRNPFFLFAVAAPAHFVLLQRYPLGHQSKTWTGWRSVIGTNLGIGVYYGTLIWVFGFESFVWVYTPVVFLSAAGAVWLFYVQHQYDPTYFQRGSEWSYEQAAVEGSSFYDLPRLLHWACGNIGYHHIHHLNPKVPNYRLAAKALSLRDSLGTATLALWDERNQCLVRFGDL